METALVKRRQWEDLVTMYLDQKDVRTAKKHYRGHLQRFFQWIEAEAPAALDGGLQKADLLRWRDYMAGLVEAERYSPYTVNVAITAVKGLFAWMVDEGMIPRDPMRGVKGLKTGGGMCKDALTETAACRLITEAENPRDRALLHLMLSTGIRCCEAARANVEDIGVRSGFKVLYVRGKMRDSKDDYVTLAEDTVTLINRYLEDRGGKLTGPLFTSSSRTNRGARLSPDAISRLVKRHLVRIGEVSPRLTAHSLRHTAATTWIEHGGDLYEAQINLRHKSSDTTRRYLHDTRKLRSGFSEHIIEYLGVKVC